MTTQPTPSIPSTPPATSVPHLPGRRQPNQPVYARLPRAPITGSPVPHLTSLYHFHRAGEYGDRSWPGNCGGNLIKDLLNYFKPAMMFDPMTGSGTAATCARNSAFLACSCDIHQGFDACDPHGLSRGEHVRFHLGTPALLAAEALRRRSPRPVAITRRSSISCGATASSSATVPGRLKPRRQARHPDGRLFRPRRRIRAAGLPHQATGLRRRA